jgi:glycosyltransferase involved in cell wall biosynthesis
VVVPCHNEGTTVAAVVNGFREVLPRARMVVVDNLSTDDTTERARTTGADVLQVPNPGKGRAVRRAFEVVDEDVVLLVDGDATYDPSVAPALVHKVFCEGYDLVNVQRVTDEGEMDTATYRSGHQIGNKALTSLQRTLTGIRLSDILTGYKAMSRRFVASFPVRSKRFQLEVEIASHAVAMDFAYAEMPASYGARPEGSSSKLSTYRDGLSILRAIFRLHRDLQPFVAFAALSSVWFVATLVLVIPPIVEYFQTGKVERFPSFIAGTATFIVAMLLLTSGWLLERTRTLRRDLLQIAANNAEHMSRHAADDSRL